MIMVRSSDAYYLWYKCIFLQLSVPATGCYEFRPISCYLGDEDICLTLPYVADGTPCIPTSPAGGKSYVSMEYHGRSQRFYKVEAHQK